MIVDTSALVAVALAEQQSATLLDALLAEPNIIPAPVLVDYERVGMKGNPLMRGDRAALIAELLANKSVVGEFTAEDAGNAVAANGLYGTGNGRGGTLNMLDLMVYGMARRMDLPILCTGRDFASTDIAIHPASRGW